jgi:hypothetical protein
MWSLDEIAIEILEADAPVASVEIITPAGRIEVVCSIRRAGRVLYCDGVHISGLDAGAVGRAGLNAIGRKLLVEADVDRIVIKGSTRATGRTAGRVPRPIRFPR